MIKKAFSLTRKERLKFKSPIRGMYVDDEYDTLDLYLNRYDTAVITLETALSLYHLIDEWPNEPFSLCFKAGYRKVVDKNIKQYRDLPKVFSLGVTNIKRGNRSFKIYDKERLLLELWRKRKHISNDIYKEAIYRYRDLARNNELNIPLLKKYIASVPKSDLFYCKLSDEVL